MYRMFAFLILATACSPSDRNIRHFVPQTQISQTISRDTEVFRDGKDHISVRTIVLQGHGKVGYHLSLSVLRGGPNAPIILSMTSQGEPLAYERHDRLRTFCIDHCHKAEIGAVSLSKSTFRTAANQGMTIMVHGLRRNYIATVPPHIFWTALDTAGILAPTKPRQFRIP